jgi:hypothetical protein
LITRKRRQNGKKPPIRRIAPGHGPDPRAVGLLEWGSLRCRADAERSDRVDHGVIVRSPSALRRRVCRSGRRQAVPGARRCAITACSTAARHLTTQGQTQIHSGLGADRIGEKLSRKAALHLRSPFDLVCRSRSAMPQGDRQDAASSSQRAAARPSSKIALRPQRSPTS